MIREKVLITHRCLACEYGPCFVTSGRPTISTRACRFAKPEFVILKTTKTRVKQWK